MKKTIFITGSTDGIGKLAAERFLADGHTVLIHGRSAPKASRVRDELLAKYDGASVYVHVADLSDLAAVVPLAAEVSAQHGAVDVLVNNAGVFTVHDPKTEDGLDVRFVVNTLAPWVLTRALLPVIPARGRVVNLSSAAQAPVNLDALRGDVDLSNNAAYAQSKLAITMWTRSLASELGAEGPQIIALNPASFLGTNMVRDAYGSEGKDVGIGADIIHRAALSDEFQDATGRYYDNDSASFAPPHADALDDDKVADVVRVMRDVLAGLGPKFGAS